MKDTAIGIIGNIVNITTFDKDQIKRLDALVNEFPKECAFFMMQEKAKSYFVPAKYIAFENENGEEVVLNSVEDGLRFNGELINWHRKIAQKGD